MYNTLSLSLSLSLSHTHTHTHTHTLYAGSTRGAVSDDQVLDKITERITGRLREEIRQEVIREEKELAKRRGEEEEQQMNKLEVKGGKKVYIYVYFMCGWVVACMCVHVYLYL